MTRRSIPCGLLLLLPLLGAAAAPSPAPVSDPLLAAYSLIYNGDNIGAVGRLEDLLKKKPDDLPLRYGWLMAQRGRLKDAALRPPFEEALDAFIGVAGERHKRNSDDGEALFYLATAHLLRAEYRLDYDQGMFGAARDGANTKSHIEAYLKQHPGDADAYFAAGMYNYYADIGPTFIQFLRFLLFLPRGDRALGLHQIERAAAEGHLFGPLARSVLMEIYSTYEGRGPEAVTAGEMLQRQFPKNDDVALRLAAIHAGPLFEDRARAGAVYQGVIDRHQADDTPDGAAARYRAILGLAGLKQEEWRVEEAIAILTPTIDAKVGAPDWVLPQFLIRRANYWMLLNDPAASRDSRRVLNDPLMAAWHPAATDMLKTIEQRAATGEAATYAALIPGNRLVVERRWDEAERAYKPLRARDPQNPQIRYRLAYLDFARDRLEGALPAFSALAAGGRETADVVKAQALLYLGRIHDLAGRRDDAKEAYQRVVDGFGKQRASEAAKVGLLTPYHRPTPLAAAQ